MDSTAPPPEQSRPLVWAHDPTPTTIGDHRTTGTWTAYVAENRHHGFEAVVYGLRDGGFLYFVLHGYAFNPGHVDDDQSIALASNVRALTFAAAERAIITLIRRARRRP